MRTQYCQLTSIRQEPEFGTSKHYKKKSMEVYYLDEWFVILATRNTQFDQEVALVMQTTHAQRWQYLDRVD